MVVMRECGGGKIHCGTSWLNNERESDVINLVISATFLIFFKVSSRMFVVEIKGKFWNKPVFTSNYRAINQSQIKNHEIAKSTRKVREFLQKFHRLSA
jgi:hypothetical protein